LNAVTLDPAVLAADLIRCPSVTPADAGALDILSGALRAIGFGCERMPFQEAGTERVDNLWARIGSAGPLLCFAGHTDVVPPGDPAAWRLDAFGGTIADGCLWGRGAVDMKGAIAAFTVAAARFVARRGRDFGGSIALLITGDEEADAVNGTKPVLDALAARGETIDLCLVGEPTSEARVGDVIKIGRRGSLSGRLTVRGVQGHSAYPQKADNPLPRLVAMLASLGTGRLDDGTAHFEPSHVAITSIDVGNKASNVIPAEGRAAFNIRFNDSQSIAGLEAMLRRRFGEASDRLGGGDWSLEILRSNGEAFLTPPGPLTALVAGAVERVTGARPDFSTGGGTSDARFIRAFAPVVELGLVNATIHKVDEHVPLEDLATLTSIYEAVLDAAFAR
jgi:succinyl-diaminopimelate desuccinylase